MRPFIIFWVSTSFWFLYSFIVGYYPSSYFYKDEYDSVGSIIRIMLSTALGFLLHGFIIFNFAVIFQLKINSFSFTTSILLLVLSLIITLSRSKTNTIFLKLIFKEYWIFIIIILIIIPISAFHIFYPMIRYDHIASYAIGNDGAAYFRSIEGLVKDYWRPGGEQNLIVWLRPLMQYIMAIPSSVAKLPSHYSYSISSAMIMLLNTFCLSLIAFKIFFISNAIKVWVSIIISAFTFGVAGCFSTLYYNGTLSQYFGSLPVFFAFTFLYLKKGVVNQVFWYFFSFCFIITMYSIGNILIPITFIMGFIVLTILFDWKTNELGEKKYKKIFVVVFALLGAISIYNYEISSIFDWAGSRNLGLNTNFLSSIVIDFGLYSKYLGRGSEQENLLGLTMIFMFAVSLLQIKSIEKPYLIFLIFPFIVSLVFALFDGRNLFLTKYGCLIFPLISLNLHSLLKFSFSDFTDFKKYFSALIYSATLNIHSFLKFLFSDFKKLFSVIIYCASFIILSSSFIILTYLGFWQLNDFYIVMVNDRRIFVDTQLEKVKEIMINTRNENANILGVDYFSERNPFLRSFFNTFNWQPVRSSRIWPDYAFTATHHPKELDEYNYDFIFIANDFVGPADLIKNNESHILGKVSPTFFLLDNKASYIDFDLNFEPYKITQISKNPLASKFSLISKAHESIVTFVNYGFHKKITLNLELLGSGNKVEIFLNNGKKIFNPLDKFANITLFLTDDCMGKINYITLKQTGEGLIVNNVTFSY